MINIIKVKLNIDMLHYRKGSILALINQKHSGEGIFLSPYFKRRIEDSKIDNCLTILDDECKIEPESPITEKQIEKPKKRGRPKAKKD